jgi:hypothetical protein
MRARACWLALALLCGCEHGFESTMWMPSRPPPEPPQRGVGQSHEPYGGRPKYLAAAGPMLPTRDATRENLCAVRSPSCIARLRTLLASVDAQILALESPPTGTEAQALRLAIAELTPLLAAYPDMMAERDELETLLDKYPALPSLQQAAAKRRMLELADLLRVELAAQ